VDWFSANVANADVTYAYLTDGGLSEEQLSSVRGLRLAKIQPNQPEQEREIETV
jgi:hypothetical protein